MAKSSLEFIRFEAEIENYGSMDRVLAKLDMKTIKLSGFHELLKVRAAEAKLPYPTREEWDSFFRQNRAMNEVRASMEEHGLGVTRWARINLLNNCGPLQMKPGQRPDTVHVQNLPTKWFVNHHNRSGVSRDRPSEDVLRKVFATFGDIRAVDIPMNDPYR